MTNGTGKSSERSFQIMLAVIMALIAALGGMTLFLNNQLWAKMDRVTTLIIRESDTLHKKIDKVDNRVDKARDSAIELTKKVAVLEFTGTSNGKKK